MVTRKSTILGILFIMFLIYPLIYSIDFVRDFGHVVDNFYFLVVVSFYFIFVLYNNEIKPRIETIGIFYFLINSIYFFEPRIILFFMILSLLLMNNIRFSINTKLLSVVIFLYILLSCVFWFNDGRYIDNGERYLGFALSPTHFSVYMLLIISLCLIDIKRKIIFLIFSSYFIWISQTRLSILLLGILLLLYFVNVESLKLRKFFWWIATIFLILLYPIYYLLFGFDSAIGGRYDDADNSFFARFQFSLALWNKWLNTDILSQVFGLGAGEARSTIIDIFGYDYQPHNDFLGLLYDFGIVGFIVYLIILFKLSVQTKLSFYISLIYLFSFYHNMIYSQFFIALITLMYFCDIEDEKFT